MKTRNLIILPCLILSLLTAAKAKGGSITNAQGFYVITNPTPTVKLAWSPPANVPNVTYNLYQGVAAGAYTNLVPGISATNFTFVFSQNMRGVTAFFAVTAVDGVGLESDFSNEVTYTPRSLPAKPSVLPPVTLVVQHSPKVSGPFTDTQMAWSVDPGISTNDFFKLRIVVAQNTAPQILPRVLPLVKPPLPLPGQ